MEKVLIIFNPVSGGTGLRNKEDVIRSFLKKENVSYDWFETQPVPKQPLKQFLGITYRRIIVIGGDGTIREVAQFLIENSLETPLAIVAQGTGNVLATSLGIPVIPLERALHFALTASARPLDAMLVNDDRYALIVVGQGYDSHFIKKATRELKRRWGFIAYIYSFLRTFFSYTHNTYSLVIDGKRLYASGKTVMVFNILSLAGLPVHDTISPQDGLFNVAVISPHSIWDSLRSIGAVLMRNSSNCIPKIKLFTGKEISINQKHGKHIQLDGEVIKGRNVRIKIVPNALSVVYTKKSA